MIPSRKTLCLCFGALAIVAALFFALREFTVALFVKVCDLERNRVEFNVVRLSGSNFGLLIGCEPSQSLQCSGVLTALEGGKELWTTQFQVDERVMRPMMLSRQGLKAYIINLPSGDQTHSLDETLSAGRSVRFKLEFQGDNVKKCSLWIMYVDKRKNQGRIVPILH